MTSNKMHADELNIDEALVRQLLRAQFPDWADLPLETIQPAGTDNAMFKLGNDMVVRLPRVKRAAANIQKEALWLPRLAPMLPIAVPTPIADGKPSHTYPLPWVICQWLPGINLSTTSLADLGQAALDMGAFVAVLQKIDPSGGPACKRGLPLQTREAETRAAIASLEDTFDTDLVTRIWESALQTPARNGPPVWIHGDLHAGNLLAKDHKISAVIDFGSAGVGDPASDMMVAWTLLDRATRETFREVVQPDDATWERGRGWALTMGIVAYPYYRESNPVFAAIAKRTVNEVLADELL